MSPSLRIVFMGTPDFSVPALQALIDDPHEVICVYTQPPRPKGRGHAVQKSPIHETAEKHGIEVRTPSSLKKSEEAQAAFTELNADVTIVAAYGLLLPPAVLESPKYGCLNIHASLLPRWRGAAPIQYAIWAGDTESGISIMQMDKGMDTGAVVAMESLPLTSDTTAQTLHDDLSALGAKMAVEALDKLAEEGILPSTPQDDAQATHAPRLRKEDGRVDWTQTAEEIDRQIRALTPWPGVWTLTNSGKRLKILSASLETGGSDLPPGTLVDRTGLVSCGNGTALRLTKIQPENTAPMDCVSAVNGGYLEDGMVFQSK